MRLLVLLSTASNDNGIGRLSRSLCKAMEEIPVSLRTVALPPPKADAQPRSVRERATFALQAVVGSLGTSAVFVNHIDLSPVARLTGIRCRICLLHGFESWDRTVPDPASWTYWSVSQYTADRFAANNPKASVRAIPVPIDEVFSKDFSSCPDPPLVTHCQATFPDGFVLTVGRMGSGDAYKGYGRLLRCFQEVLTARPGARVGVVLVGDGSSRASLEQEARRLGIQSHAIFAGKVSDSELGALYARARVFCLPSERTDSAASGEGFGLVYLEAASQGTPVIAVASAGAGEAVTPEIGRLLPPNDDNQLVRALQDALDGRDVFRPADRPGRRELVLTGHAPTVTRRWCAEQFSEMRRQS